MPCLFKWSETRGWARDSPWLWHPGQTSCELQNRRIIGLKNSKWNSEITLCLKIKLYILLLISSGLLEKQFVWKNLQAPTCVWRTVNHLLDKLNWSENPGTFSSIHHPPWDRNYVLVNSSVWIGNQLISRLDVSFVDGWRIEKLRIDMLFYHNDFNPGCPRRSLTHAQCKGTAASNTFVLTKGSYLEMVKVAFCSCFGRLKCTVPKHNQQECLPVGCVSSAAVAVSTALWTEYLTHACENIRGVILYAVDKANF